uniref:Cytochrome P450 n=1 Tax=Glossina brevipalpis TaxID=37001 RepID=A0A1A9W2D9_9MUSC
MLKLLGYFQKTSQNIKQSSPFKHRSSTLSSDNATLENNYDFNKKWQEAKPFEQIPGDTKLSLLRKLLLGGKYYKLKPLEMLSAYRKEWGDVAILRGFFGKKDFIVTHNPQDFEEVLRNDGTWPVRPGMEGLHYYRSVWRKNFYQGVEGLLAAKGEKWGTFRKTVNPVLMQPKNVKLYMHKMSEVNREFIERIRAIRDPSSLEVPATFEEEINRWTLESVAVVALDKQLGLINENRNNSEAKKLFVALNEFISLLYEIEFKPSLWKYIHTPTFKRLMGALDTLQEITTNYVREAIERIEKQNNTVPKRGEKSVLEKLLQIDKKIAEVMAIDMLLAGVDTTTTTFTGLLLCLAKNPDKQNKLRQEVKQILPEKDSEFQENALQNIPYLRACIKESQRMYPLGAGNARINQRDVVLSGYRVPSGTQVAMIAETLYRSEQHFTRANDYLPERWLRPEQTNEDVSALKPSNPFVFLPFGFGSRSCVGRRIVAMELELGIARLIRNFQVEFHYSTENAFRNIQIYVPNIPLRFKFIDCEK